MTLMDLKFSTMDWVTSISNNRMNKLLLIIAGAFVVWSCNSSNLGDNFFLLEGDNINDRVIVYCTGKDNNECYSGIPIIPTYERQFSNGRYAEHVELAKSNKDWILARTVTVDGNQKYYWILNKRINGSSSNDELKNSIGKNVYGPFDSTKFLNKKKELGINMELE